MRVEKQHRILGHTIEIKIRKPEKRYEVLGHIVRESELKSKEGGLTMLGVLVNIHARNLEKKDAVCARNSEQALRQHLEARPRGGRKQCQVR